MPIAYRARPLAVLAAASFVVPLPQRGRVSPTAAMSMARMAHTVTVLANGRALVAGGFNSAASAAKGAEMYDPGTGRFSLLPRMVTLRHSHTATALPNGKVLIAGGYAEGNTVVAAAELYDPATNTFSATGSLVAARAGHVAVLLGNGKVLIAGGVGPDWTFLASAELYDPALGTFSPTGAMTVSRESHAAVRLTDGRVLIVGGHRGRRADITLYASAEAYDMSTGTFRRVGDMQVRRHKHDGVLLRDGHVLISGGTDERDNEGVYNTTELFDPSTGTFAAGPIMKRPRYKHNGSSVLLPSGLALIAGGAPQAETYDPVTKTFTIVPSNMEMSGQFSAVGVLSGGRVLITGGYGNDRGPQASAWLYRP